MKTEMKKVVIDGITHIPESEVIKNEVSTEGLSYMMVRTYSAGVFAGYLKERNGKEGVLLNARRIWYWDGAASLSQLAIEGTSKPENCKFPCEVSQVELTEIIELIPITEKAAKSIKSVKVWEQ